MMSEDKTFVSHMVQTLTELKVKHEEILKKIDDFNNKKIENKLNQLNQSWSLFILNEMNRGNHQYLSQLEKETVNFLSKMKILSINLTEDVSAFDDAYVIRLNIQYKETELSMTLKFYYDRMDNNDNKMDDFYAIVEEPFPLSSNEREVLSDVFIKFDLFKKVEEFIGWIGDLQYGYDEKSQELQLEYAKKYDQLKHNIQHPNDLRAFKKYWTLFINEKYDGQDTVYYMVMLNNYLFNALKEITFEHIYFIDLVQAFGYEEIKLGFTHKTRRCSLSLRFYPEGRGKEQEEYYTLQEYQLPCPPLSREEEAVVSDIFVSFDLSKKIKMFTEFPIEG